ncbi:hypothetical protein [Peribacillus frigoritolerans]
MNKYISILEQENEDFEIIYWDRLGSPDCPEKYKSIVFQKPSRLNLSHKDKIKDFLEFRRFVIKNINKRKYDKLIVLTSLTGIFLFDYLQKNYKNKFIFDIRDYTFENFYPYKMIENRVIKSSYFTTISSEEFKMFLPSSNKYILSHNILREEIEQANEFNKPKERDGIITVSFIGAIRHFDIDSKIALKLANDDRFKVVYHGYGVAYEKFKAFCQERKLDVQITGKYDRKDKIKLLANADIINAYYGIESYANLFAMPNKYYDSLIYKIPFWANPKVYSGQRSIKSGIGLNADLESESFANDLYHEYMEIDRLKFERDCNQELSKVVKEDELFISKVQEFIEIGGLK